MNKYISMIFVLNCYFIVILDHEHERKIKSNSIKNENQD